MSSKLLVVSGEASETDSENENETPKNTPNKMATSIQGAVISGEDSESENETIIQVSDAGVATGSAVVSADRQGKGDKYDSLLHKKLKESNKDIRRDLETFTERTISEAADALNSTEQHLLRSQITLQSALTSLRSLENNSIHIRNKLKDILSANFLPNIKTES